MVSTVRQDVMEALEKAQVALEEMKVIEAKTKMCSWRYKDLVISYNSEERLRKAVEDLGYEWSKGTFRE